MWERYILKDRAKDCLRRYYWPAFVVCLLVGILGGNAGWGASIGGRSSGSSDHHYNGGWDSYGYGEYFWPVLIGVSVAMIIFVAVAFAFAILVGNVITVGKCRFFMESRQWGQSAGIGRVFYGFSSGAYWNIVKTMFLTGLFIFLWSLLLVIPGIIKGYQYAMVPYILSEYPDMDYREVLDRSRMMMDGNKMELFILQLSFIGWFLLGVLACGFGVLFVTPYYEATLAELYGVLRETGPSAY